MTELKRLWFFFGGNICQLLPLSGVSIQQENARLHKSALAILIAALCIHGVAQGADSKKIIVFPPKGSQLDDSLRWLGEGIAESISKQLSLSGINATKGSRRIDLVKSMNLPFGMPLSQASMMRIARLESADFLAMGEYEIAGGNMRIEMHVFDMNALKMSGAISANGPLSALAQMENELAWLILANTGLKQAISKDTFRERIRKAPDDAYHFYIACLYGYGEGDPAGLLLKAIEIFPDFREARLALSRLYFEMGNCDSAIKHLAEDFETGEAGLEIKFIKATCCLQRQKPSEAIPIFSHILKYSRPVEVLNNLGVAYLATGDTVQAIDCFKEAQALANEDPTVLLNLAVALFISGDPVRAGNTAEQALKLDPQNQRLQLLQSFLKMRANGGDRFPTEEEARGFGINTGSIRPEAPHTWVLPMRIWKECKEP